MHIINEPLYQLFLDFCVERQAIYIRKNQGQPWPWTNDPTLRTAKINNLFRRQDRFTKLELTEIDHQPFAEQVRRILILRHAISPAIYWAAAGEPRGTNDWQLTVKDLELLRGSQSWGTQYISDVLPMDTQGLSLEQAVVEHLAHVQERFAQVAFLLAITNSAGECVHILRQNFPHLDPFRCYEVFTSLTYCPDFQWGENDYLYIGHGSTAITHGLLGQELATLSGAKKLARKIEFDLDCRGCSRAWQFSVRAMEDSFCEFRKYLESKAGGRKHRTYAHRAQDSGANMFKRT